MRIVILTVLCAGSLWAQGLVTKSAGKTPPAGSATELQYRSGGVFGAITGSAFDGTYLTIPNLQLGSSAVRCTPVAGVVTCTDPTVGTGVAKWIFKGGAGQGTTDAALEIQNKTGAAVLRVFPDAAAVFATFEAGSHSVNFRKDVGILMAQGLNVRSTDARFASAMELCWTDGAWTSALDVCIERSAAGVLRASLSPGTGYAVWDIAGIRISGTAPSGNVLRGNGTNFVPAQLNYSDLAGNLDVPDNGTRPTCDVSVRGVLWMDEGGAGVADSLAVCAKDAADSYAWRAIY